MANSKPAPVAYSYIRFSTREQRTGDSYRRQTAAAEAWAAGNKVRLDTSSYQDLGVSAYTGAHRENPDRHGLALFLRAIEERKIPKGAYLLVENLDRLTREHLRAALTLFLNILDAGVHLVSLSPEKVFRADATGDDVTMDMMLAIVELSRGNRESARRSDLLGKVWGAKKAAAREGKVATRMLPAWLKVVGKTIVPDEARAAVVKRIFRLAEDGHGNGAIVKTLNAEQVPVFGRKAKIWVRSYVATVLNNRAVIGEYQPYVGNRRKARKPDGPPIAGYYPVVVTESEWHAARLAAAGRKRTTGRPGKWVGIFTGLLRDARDGGAIHYVDKGKQVPGYTLMPYYADSGFTGSSRITFPAGAFEDAVLSKLQEIDPREVLPRGDQAADKVTALAGREVELAGRVERIKAALATGGEVESAIEVLRKLDGELAGVRAELAQARAEAANPLSEAWGEVRPLVALLRDAPDPQEARTRLRAAVRRIVSEVTCLFVAGRGDPNTAFRFAAVQVLFHGGGHRDYFILKRRALKTQVTIPSSWWVRSFTDSGFGDELDLKRKAGVRALVKVLEAIDPRTLVPDSE